MISESSSSRSASVSISRIASIRAWSRAGSLILWNATGRILPQLENNADCSVFVMSRHQRDGKDHERGATFQPAPKSLALGSVGGGGGGDARNGDRPRAIVLAEAV